MPASRPSRIQAPVFEPILHWLCQCQVRCQLFILSHKNIGSSRRIRSIYSMRSVLSDSDSRAITDKTEEVSGAVYRELPPTGLFCLLAVERQRHFVTGLPIHSRFRRIERVGYCVKSRTLFSQAKSTQISHRNWKVGCAAICNILEKIIIKHVLTILLWRSELKNSHKLVCILINKININQ